MFTFTEVGWKDVNDMSLTYRIYKSTLYRRYIDYIPTIYRLYTDDISTIYRRYIDNISTMYRLYIDDISTIYRRYIDDTSTICSLYTDDISTMYRRYLVDISSGNQVGSLAPFLLSLTTDGRRTKMRLNSSLFFRSSASRKSKLWSLFLLSGFINSIFSGCAIQRPCVRIVRL